MDYCVASIMLQRRYSGQWVAFTHTASGTFQYTPRMMLAAKTSLNGLVLTARRMPKATLEFIAVANPENIRQLVRHTADLTASHEELRSTMSAIYNSIKESGGLHAVAIMNAAKRAYDDSANIAGIAVKESEMNLIPLTHDELCQIGWRFLQSNGFKVAFHDRFKAWTPYGEQADAIDFVTVHPVSSEAKCSSRLAC